MASPNPLAQPPQPTPTMSASSASPSTPTEDTAFNAASWSSKRDGAAETSAEATQRVRELMQVFLKQHTAYDVLPVSYRLIVLDTTLLMKKALAALIQNGVVSAPLWSASTQTFAGMLTVSDFINLIQYYHAHSSVERALDEMEQFQIQHMRDVERRIGQPAPQLLSIHPMASLDEACRLLVESRNHRLPLLDRDEETGQEMIVSMLTQYRILKFIAVNFKETKAMRQPLSELQLGTYGDTVASARMSTPVIQVISMFVDRRISAVPIVDDNGVVQNVYETVDVMSIARSGKYHELDMPVGEALEARPEDFPGVHTCMLSDTLHSIFGIIRKRRVYRLVVIDAENRLKGIVSLSDILQYLMG